MFTDSNQIRKEVSRNIKRMQYFYSGLRRFINGQLQGFIYCDKVFQTSDWRSVLLISGLWLWTERGGGLGTEIRWRGRQRGAGQGTRVRGTTSKHFRRSGCHNLPGLWFVFLGLEMIMRLSSYWESEEMELLEWESLSYLFSNWWWMQGRPNIEFLSIISFRSLK